MRGLVMKIRIEPRGVGHGEPCRPSAPSILTRLLVASALVGVTATGAVAASATTTWVASSSNPAAPGAAVTFSTVVFPGGDGAPTGLMWFTRNINAVFATATLDPYAVGSVRTMATGAHHGCAVNAPNTVLCWGRNDRGQVGNSSSSDTTTPTRVDGAAEAIAAVTAGAFHSCALTALGGVKCWGANDHGQLGNGLTADNSSATDVMGLTSGVVAISAGDFHTCALTAGGSVMCWGRNDDGQLGDATTTDSHWPVTVTRLVAGVGSISAGGRHSCAVTVGGAAKCWGRNDHDQLGHGAGPSSPVAVDVAGLTAGVSAISAGGDSTCAVVSGGAKCWGDGAAGQLGNGTLATQSSPVDVTNLTSGVATISVGSTHACAVTTAGAALCWGRNTAGELGNGTTSNSSVPVGVSGLGSGIASISVGSSYDGAGNGAEHGCAQWLSGMAACWGSNQFGQIGNNSHVDANHAVVLGGFVSVIPAGARVTNPSLPAGSSSIGAGYVGDATHAGSVSDQLVQVMGSLPTVTDLTAAKTTAVVGESVPFTATVSTSDGAPTGTMQFWTDAVASPATALTGTTALLFVAAPGPGTRTVWARYGGDGSHTASLSNTSVLTVVRGSTTTTLAPAATTIPVGGSVLVTATVTAAAPTTASPEGGTVTFSAGSTPVGSAPVSGGTASLTVGGLPIGTTTITASFERTTDLETSTSSPVTVTVDRRTGAEFRANTRTAGSQQLPAVATLKAGGFVVVWASKDQDGSDWGIYGQRYKADGTRAGGEFRVNTTTTDAQSWPAIAATGDGGFVVAWLGSDTGTGAPGIWAQRWSATGRRLGGELRVDVTAGDRPTAPAVAASPKGGFLVTWVSNTGSGTTFDVRGRRYGATGRPIGRETELNTKPMPTLTSGASVAALDDGSWAVTWTRAARPGAAPIVVARRLTAAGARLGAEIAVTSATFAQSDPVAVGLIGEGFLVAWVSQGQDGSGKGIFAQRYGATGTKLGPAFLVNKTVRSDQSEPALASRPGGGFLAAWTSAGQDGSGKGVYGRLYGYGATPIDTEFRLNTTTSKNQSQPSVAMTSATDAVTVWTSVGTDGGLEGVYGQRLHLPVE